MESADPRKPTHPGHEVLVCHRCGWPFPNAHPSARHRRAHKRICGTVEGYEVVADSAPTLTLTHTHSQRSAISSFSDDEHGTDRDSKASRAKVKINTSLNKGGSGRVLERMNTSSDDVFADAVSEFVDANASLAGDEGLQITSENTSHNTVGVPTFNPPVEDSVVTGVGSTMLSDQEKVMSFSENPAKFETFTDACEENQRTDDFEDHTSTVMETDLTKINHASEVNAAPVIVPISDASKTCETVTEDLYVVVSENEEKQDVKSGSETSVDDQSQEGNIFLRSIDEISVVNVENIPQNKLDELVTELVTEGYDASTSLKAIEDNKVDEVPRGDIAVQVKNEVVDYGCEIEGGVSCSLSGDGVAAAPTAAAETVKTSSAHTVTVTGHGSEDSNKRYPDNLTESPSSDNRATYTTDKSGQVASNGGNDIIDSANRGITEEEFVADAERDEIEAKLSDPSFDMCSVGHGGMLHVVSAAGTHKITETELLNGIGTGNAERFAPKELSVNIDSSFVESIGITSGAAHNQLDMIVESSFQLSSDVNSLVGDDSIGNNKRTSKEVKSSRSEGCDPVTDPKPVRHDVLLQKLEVYRSDDMPLEASVATECLSQSLGTNKVVDVGVLCKDASVKDFGQPRPCDADPEKGTISSVADAPFEISSPNGSSSDGNWGSVSVLSTMSDATVDVKKTKDAQEGQSHEKTDIFDPPSFLTLVEPQAQEAAAAEVPGCAKAAWFPSITNVANDSHGRKKNEEIIAKVTKCSAGKQHSPLKTLLSEVPNNENNSPVKSSSAAVKTVNSILGSEEAELGKIKLDSEAKEWPDEIKREKRKVKGKPYWVPFMCCSSSVK